MSSESRCPLCDTLRVLHINERPECPESPVMRFRDRPEWRAHVRRQPLSAQAAALLDEAGNT